MKETFSGVFFISLSGVISNRGNLWLIMSHAWALLWLYNANVGSDCFSALFLNYLCNLNKEFNCLPAKKMTIIYFILLYHNSFQVSENFCLPFSHKTIILGAPNSIPRITFRYIFQYVVSREDGRYGLRLLCACMLVIRWFGSDVTHVRSYQYFDLHHQ